MRSLLLLGSAALFALATGSAEAAHTRATLILADGMVRPGDTVLAGIHLEMDPAWHTYWTNSGASGIATKVQWNLPRGVTAGDIQWPVPEKLPPDDLTTYIYQNDVVLLVPLKVAYGVPRGNVELSATVSWLECKEQCVPGKADISATLSIGPETKPSANAELIRKWQQKLPQPAGNLSARAWWERAAQDDLRPLIVEWSSPTVDGDADFYPQASEQFEVQGATERVPGDPGKVRLRKEVKKFQGDWPKEISGLLIQRSGEKQVAYEATLPLGHAPAAGKAQLPLWQMLIYAFIGGLILNVMPCVLPVIALKILGFVKDAGNAPRLARRLGLIYALGVLVSFLVLAGVAILLKAAGHSASWGMQFSSSYFLVIMTTFVTLIALNLFGVFEIGLGGRALGAATVLSSRHGAAGAFFNGLLATALATSCTAPFLGAAIGFALIGDVSRSVVIAVFLTVGLGLAAPYVILSWQPAWLKFVPKPGPWMERFKIAMGFPMLATSVWLVSLAPSYFGKRALWLGIFLVMVALAAWVYGEFVQRGRGRRGIALAVMLALLVGGYAYAIEGQLDWRRPIPEAQASGVLKESPQGIEWQRWSAAAVAHAQEEGQPVLVDFTADWCLTCQANKRVAIDIPSVRSKLNEIGAAAFLGDYTRFPDDITQELNRYGRAGVPLVLVYPGKAGAPPIVLPELLTPGVVLDALDRVSK